MAFDEREREELRGKFERLAESRDPALRNELVTAHLGLAEYLARRFDNRGEHVDDLVQVASVGLVKAVDRFDPSRGLEFATYATPTIVGELPPRERAILHLRFFQGKTQSEIAERMGISQMHVSRLLARSLTQLREAAGADEAE